MASLSRLDKGPATLPGLWMIQFKDKAGKRRTLRAGVRMSRQQAETLQNHVQAINVFNICGLQIGEDTAHWIAALEADLRGKLTAIGLLGETAAPKAHTLGPFLKDYFANRREQVKAGQITESSLNVDQLAADCLLEHFGEDRALADITAADADKFRTWLLIKGSRPVKRCGPEVVILPRKPLVQSTANKRCSVASKFFRHAIAAEILTKNPFASVERANMASEKITEISTADALLVLDQLPATEWKLLFALARWGGLRKAEPRGLRWADIDRDGERFLVHAPKTRKHNPTRWVPIFPELADLFARRYAEASVGEVYVLPMLAEITDTALDKPLCRAITRAGLPVWSRLWQNLRAQRQTELEDRFPTHVVCAWLGNSPKTARKHYLRVTTDHFDKATGKASDPATAPAKRKRCKNVKTPQGALQNALHGQGANMPTAPYPAK